VQLVKLEQVPDAVPLPHWASVSVTLHTPEVMFTVPVPDVTPVLKEAAPPEVTVICVDWLAPLVQVPVFAVLVAAAVQVPA